MNKYTMMIELFSSTPKFQTKEKYKKMLNRYKLLQKNFPERVIISESVYHTKKSPYYDVRLYCNSNEVPFFYKQIEDMNLFIEQVVKSNQ